MQKGGDKRINNFIDGLRSWLFFTQFCLDSTNEFHSPDVSPPSRTFRLRASRTFLIDAINLPKSRHKKKLQIILQLFQPSNLILPTREKLHNCTVWILLTVCRFFWVRSCKIKELLAEKFPLSAWRTPTKDQRCLLVCVISNLEWWKAFKSPKYVEL